MDSCSISTPCVKAEINKNTHAQESKLLLHCAESLRHNNVYIIIVFMNARRK